MQSFSFPLSANKNAKILILGTMPGKKSPEMQEYYPYKYNTFWKIMFKLFNSLFNGAAAMNYYKKYVGFDDKHIFHLLPSSSPVNARMSFEEKLKKCSLIKKILKNEK